MPSLLYTCPTTRHKASTGIEMSVESLRKCWRMAVRVNCPHCGQVHEISVRETYVDTGFLWYIIRGGLDRYSGRSGDFVLVLRCCHAAALSPTAWTSASRSSMTRW